MQRVAVFYSRLKPISIVCICLFDQESHLLQNSQKNPSLRVYVHERLNQ